MSVFRKKFLLVLSTVLVAVGIVGCYDDSALSGRLDELESRMDALEAAVNSNARSLGTLLSGDYITDVERRGEDYVISFVNHSDVTIRPASQGEKGEPGPSGDKGEEGDAGSDGKDGASPILGIARDSDGNWYWKVNGDWLLDGQGNRLRANGIDGQDGEDGEDATDGIVPQFKIEDGNWFVSTDGGKTWTPAGKADGESGVAGDDYFEGIDTDSPYYVVFYLVDGTVITVPRLTRLQIGENPLGESIYCRQNVASLLTVVLPGDLSAETFAALKAKIEYAGGSSVSLVTKAAEDEWKVTAFAPVFSEDQPKCAYIKVVPPDNAASTAVLEVSLVTKDGTTVTAARVLTTVPKGGSEDPTGAVVSYKIENVGTYTLDVVCTPSQRCKVYSATIVSAGLEGPYDKSGQGASVPRTDYEEMLRDAMTQFKEVLKPNHDQYAKQPYLTKTDPYTFTAEDLVKNTSYATQECAGYENIFPQSNPFAVIVMWEDVDGEFGIEYKEVRFKSLAGNRCDLRPTIELGEVTINYFEATISCPEASKLLYYMPTNDAFPGEISDDMKLACARTYRGPIHFDTSGSRLSTNTVYYLVAVAIDEQGRVGQETVCTVRTLGFTSDGTAIMTGAFFDEQKFRSEITGHFTFSDNARRVRVFTLPKHYYLATVAPGKDEFAYAGGASGYVRDVLLDDYYANSRIEVAVPSNGLLNYTFPLSNCVEGENEDRRVFWDSEYVFWATVQDENGDWGYPQNIASIALGVEDDYDWYVYLPVITEDEPISFDSEGSLEASALTRTSTDLLPVRFNATDLAWIRIFCMDLDTFVLTCTYDDDSHYTYYPFTDMISQPSFRKAWIDVKVTDLQQTVDYDIPVAAGKKYILIAAGIDHDGNFTVPFNLAKVLNGSDVDETSYYSGVNYRVPTWYDNPLTLGGGSGDDDPLWNGRAATISGITPATDGGSAAGGLKLTVDKTEGVVAVYSLFVETQSLDAEVLRSRIKEVFPDIYTAGKTTDTVYASDLGNVYYYKQNLSSGWGTTVTVRSWPNYWSGRTMVLVFVDDDTRFNINCYIKCIDGNSELVYF